MHMFTLKVAEILFMEETSWTKQITTKTP